MTSRPTLLILRALGLGDVLVAVPALRALAAAFPDHRRLLAAPAVLGDLLALVPRGIQPVVHEMVDTDFTTGVGTLIGRCDRPDVAVNLHGRGPQSHRALRALAPGRLIGFGAPAAGHDGPDWVADEHESVRWCRLLQAEGIPADPRALRLEPPSRHPPPRAVGATVVHPGAKAASRRWPVDRWAAVARGEQAAGRRVVVTGGPDEVALARAVAAAADLPDAHVLAGRTTLTDLAAVVAAAGTVVCGDTGVGHLATALGTPSVLLFGPTPPSRWGPAVDRARHVVLWAGSTGDPLGDRPDPGLLSLAVEQVQAALAALRAGQRVPSG